MRKLPKISLRRDPAAVTISVVAAAIGLFSIWAALAGVMGEDNSDLSATADTTRLPAIIDSPDAVSRGGGAATRNTSLASARAGGGLIALVIDDLGGDPASTRRALRLPAAVTLAFLPYPKETPRLAADGARAGHEIIAHVPMEAEKGAYPGLEALEAVLTPEENIARLELSLSRVPFAIGINNHMGSLFTANADALAPVMRTLKARNLFFFDSRTTLQTKVPQIAAREGVPSLGRDVFLDDIQTEDAVRAELAKADRLAREHGLATVIGHPHKVTLAILEEWVAQNRGRLIPLSEALRLRSANEAAVR